MGRCLKYKLLALIVIFGSAAIGSVALLTQPQCQPQPQPQLLKDFDGQMTSVIFAPNGTKITVCIENKGNKSFKFNRVVVSDGWLRAVSYDIEISTLYSLEKFNITLRHYWKPDSAYSLVLPVVYEGQEQYMQIRYNTHSPSDYPYILEITDVTFTGTKVYDELGALIAIRDRKANINFINHHDTIDLTIMEIKTAESNIWVRHRLLPKESGSITLDYFEWEPGSHYTFLLVGIHGEPREEQDIVGINDEVYFSNYYSCTP